MRFKFLLFALVGFAIANGGGVAYYLVQHKQLAETIRPPDTSVGRAIPVRHGVDLSGTKWESQMSQCRVVRISDDNCVYCKMDKPLYTALLDTARTSNCEVLEISPKAGQMTADPRQGVVQLKFVDSGLGDAAVPFVTPTTIILDHAWSVKWARRGALDEKSLAKSIASLRALSARKTL